MDAPVHDTQAWLARLEAMAPLVEAERTRMDAEGRLPPGLFAALAESGLFRLWLPRALGGPEMSPLDFMEIVGAAAALDGSVGWVVGNGAGASRVAGYLPEEAARRCFGAPNSFLVTATGTVGRAEPVAGGYRVSGRWPFGSGIHHATAVLGLCAVAEGDSPARQIMCLAPREAAAIASTWDASGMRGTGSCDWTLDEVFVPEALTFAFPQQPAMQPGLLYRLPILSTFAWSVAVVPPAIARACLSAFTGLAQDRVRLGTAQALRDRETIQAMVGRADTALRAARGLMVESMQALLDAVDRGEPDLLPWRLQLRVAASHAAEVALDVAAAVERAAGTAAMLESGPLARRLRDLRAAVQHVAVAPHVFTVAGRMQLGLDPGTTRV